MTDTTPRIAAPLLAAAQAQKHVTHNEALLQFDALLCCRILDRDLAAPPASPADGDAYLVTATGTGAWAGQDGNIAFAIDGGWRFYAPFDGLSAFVADEAVMLVYTASGWTDWASRARSAKCAAAGRQHDRRRHQQTGGEIVCRCCSTMSATTSKSSSTSTPPATPASFLFQTDYSGRAEFGLAGDDDFHVKVSPDGSSWVEALHVKTSGEVGIGTDAPSYDLDVNGDGNLDIRFSGALSVSLYLRGPQCLDRRKGHAASRQ